MFGFGKKKYWRINLGVAQIRNAGCDGVDSYGDEKFCKTVTEIRLLPEAGDYLEQKNPKSGDRFILSGVANLDANEAGDISHTVIGYGEIRDHQYTGTGSAKLLLQKFQRLKGSRATRAIRAPGVKGNVHEISKKELALFNKPQ